MCIVLGIVEVDKIIGRRYSNIHICLIKILNRNNTILVNYFYNLNSCDTLILFFVF